MNVHLFDEKSGATLFPLQVFSESDTALTDQEFLCAGTYNRFHPGEVTELPDTADFTEMQIYLNSELFTMESGVVAEYERYFNLKEAELTREVL